MHDHLVGIKDLDSFDLGGIIVAVLSHDVAGGNAIGAEPMKDGGGEA